MIVPFFLGFLPYQKIPLTWCLVAMNLFFFLVFAADNTEIAERLERIIDAPEMSDTLGRVYHQYLKHHENNDRYAAIAKKYVPDTEEQRNLLAQIALRDSEFFKSGWNENFEGDQVEISRWKDIFSTYLDLNSARPLALYGLSSIHENVWSLITYQFVHAGFMHLLGNSLYTLIFAGFIEATVGSVWLLILYVFGGAAGAMGYFLLSGLTPVPVVGASGSISALIGASIFLFEKKRARFFYFFAPSPEFYGFIFLPIFWVPIVSLVPDVTSYLMQPKELSGVAYAAHIGGAAWGMFFGVCYIASLGWRKSTT